MKQHRAVAIIMAGMLIFGTAAAWSQQRTVFGQFSADSIGTMENEAHNGKIFVNQDRIRIESESKEEEQGVMIIRLDKGVLWTLMPGEKTYMEMKSFDQAGIPKSEEELASIAEVKKMGSETVSGYPCEVTQYLYKERSQGVLTQWFSRKLNYTVKTELKKGSKLEMSQLLTNIKEGRQPDSLFEIPPGYKKFQLPGLPGMPGGAPFKLPFSGKN